MPELFDDTTGESLKPNLLLSTKNITRGLGGQIRAITTITAQFNSIDSFKT